MSPTDCVDNVKFLKSTSFLLRSECFFDATAESSAITVVIVGNNYTTEQGNFLFGGKLNQCIVNGMNGNEIFPRLLVNDNSLITGPSATALISSQPYRLCFCGNQHTKQAGGIDITAQLRYFTLKLLVVNYLLSLLQHWINWIMQYSVLFEPNYQKVQTRHPDLVHSIAYKVLMPYALR